MAENEQLSLDLGVFNIDNALADRQTDTLSDKVEYSKRALKYV